jgi:membrane associated rhomboid family serine protease
LPPPGGGSSLPPPGGSPPPAAPQPHAPWEPDEPAGPGWLKSFLDARASYAFLAAALLLFGLCVRESGISVLGVVPEATAVKYGAYHYRAVRVDGEWWRFLSTLFVSRMGLDAIIYLMIFWQLGPQLERMLGTARFSVLYLGAGAGGVAVAELLDPSTRQQLGVGDTIVAVYAALGAVPGVILGMTGSLKRTIASPEARSAVFWVGFWSVVRYAATNRVEAAILGAAVLGLLLGAGLALSKRSKGVGAAATAVPLLLIVLLIGAVTKNLRYEGGKLVDRGRPASGNAPQRPVDGEQHPDDEPVERPSALEPAETSNAAVTELREKVAALATAYGPLPPQFGYKAVEQERARALLAEATKIVNGPNNVTHELDPERIRLSIMTASFHEAHRIAKEFVLSRGSPHALALAGLTAFYLPNLERAEEYLDKAITDEAFVGEVPEVVYYYARVLEERHGLETAAAHYERYDRTVRDGPHPAWRQALVKDARAKLGR